MKLNVPGKTFLVGEYSVLLGGSAIGLATKPCFEITYDQALGLNFHTESPAGCYLRKHNKSVLVSMKDPYISGGFGRSTAEYWAAIAPDLLKINQAFYKIFEEYKSLHTGSGVDLAFQYFGQVCLADPLIQFYQTFNWHFENLDFYIISTGFKIKTHEHLKNLNLNLLRDLPALSNKITKVFSENKEFEFLALMKDWCKALEAHGLTHASSLEMKAVLEAFEPIKLAKPCGALGADVIIVFFAKSHIETVRNFLLQNKFNIQAHSSDLIEGVGSQLESIRINSQESLKGSLKGNANVV